MNNKAGIPFQQINWSHIPRQSFPGETGLAYWQVLEFAGLRIRLVEYSAGYRADHWCEKGHVVHCLSGSFVSELAGQHPVELEAGMSYVVSDKQSKHRSVSDKGALLLIVDGEFLAEQKE